MAGMLKNVFGKHGFTPLRRLALKAGPGAHFSMEDLAKVWDSEPEAHFEFIEGLQERLFEKSAAFELLRQEGRKRNGEMAARYQREISRLKIEKEKQKTNYESEMSLLESRDRFWETACARKDFELKALRNKAAAHNKIATALRAKIRKIQKEHSARTVTTITQLPMFDLVEMRRQIGQHAA